MIVRSSDLRLVYSHSGSFPVFFEAPAELRAQSSDPTRGVVIIDPLSGLLKSNELMPPNIGDAQCVNNRSKLSVR